MHRDVRCEVGFHLPNHEQKDRSDNIPYFRDWVDQCMSFLSPALTTKAGKRHSKGLRNQPLAAK